MEGIGDAAYGEVVEVMTHGRSAAAGTGASIPAKRRPSSKLWGDSTGLRPTKYSFAFVGDPFRTPVAREMLGRVFDGLGRPRDGLPVPLAEDRVDVNGRR